MKKQLINTLALLALTTVVYSQKLVNLNPNPTGEPWYVGSLRALTKEDTFKIQNTPRFTIKDVKRTKSLPSAADNTQHKYFRPIFNQQGGSCGQASGVAYNFTYAINFARNLAANTPQTQYPSHYTWNFLNGGVGNGSFYFDGWEIISANGCPNVETYGGSLWEGGDRRWMSGYSNFRAGMQNRALEMFTIDVSTPDGLLVLKEWMNNQLNGSAVGGLANFAAGVSGTFSMTMLPTGTPEAYKSVVTHWDAEVNHAMTFVGYNDSVRYDFNMDGKYTNNIDINNDNTVDMRDWEIGGLIMVNSWGTSWGDNGKAYVMYKLLAEPSSNGGIMGGIVHVIRAKAEYNPLVTLKATITHTSRNRLKITAGIASNPDATEPEYKLNLPLFNNQGGPYYMTGGNTDADKTIEVGIDITPLLSKIESNQPAKFFLVVEEKDPSGTASGQIVSFSVIDVANGNTETSSSMSNVPISNNTTTYLSVTKSLAFDKISIPTQSLPDVIAGFPYTHQLSATGGTAPYKWKWLIDYNQSDIQQPLNTVTTKKIKTTDNDDGFGELNLPFEFPFYGQKYSKVLVSTDGSVLFGNNFEYVRNEANLMASKAITVYGADLMLYESDNDGIWYQATRDSLVIYWKTSQFENPSFNAQFGLILYPNGKSKFIYGSDITENIDWVSGISNGDGENYAISSVSGTEILTQNSGVAFNPSEAPNGFKIDESGEISFTTIKGDGLWNINVLATDQNKIFTKSTITIKSVPSLEFSANQLTFQNPLDSDPFNVGKSITIKNVCSKSVSIDSIKTAGVCSYIDNNPAANKLSLGQNQEVSLNIKLKNVNRKGDNLLVDTIVIYTSFSDYIIPVFVDPEVLSSTTYTVSFKIMDGSSPVENATIEIDRLSSSLTTNAEGVVDIALPNGDYNYTTTVQNKYQKTSSLTVNGESQNITIQINPSNSGISKNDLLVAYPNPFVDKIYLLGLNKPVQVSVYSIIGELVLIQLLNSKNNVINTERLGKGLYVIKVDDKTDKVQLLKVVKY